MTLGRILYVEDNLENRILIKRVLEAAGYTFIEAENGVQGLEKALHEHPDLILMDINLPDIDGYECTARLRKASGLDRVPVLALTANVLEGDRQRALASGCDGYIPKPIDVDELPDVVARHLKQAAGEPLSPRQEVPPEQAAPPQQIISQTAAPAGEAALEPMRASDNGKPPVISSAFLKGKREA